jgi:hypothetical protein
MSNNLHSFKMFNIPAMKNEKIIDSKHLKSFVEE